MVPRDGGNADSGSADGGSADGGGADGGSSDGGMPAGGGLCTGSRWCWENPLPQGNGMTALWAVSPTDVWAAGTYGTILHFDGRAWSQVPSGTTQYLAALWGAGAKDIWAAGLGGTLLHWDGSRWSAVSATTEHLTSLWGSGPTNIWAGGNGGTLLRWNGTAWNKVASGTTERIEKLGGTAANDVWATVETAAEILHFDGTAWSKVLTPQVPTPEKMLRSLWASGPNDVWAGQNSRQGLRWDGRVWQKQTAHVPFLTLWGAAADDIWGLGGYLPDVLKRWNGTSWVSSTPPQWTVGYVEQLWGLHGTASSDVWVVSHRPYHWDGARWSTIGGGTLTDFQGAWASSVDEVWAVGSDASQLATSTGIGAIYRRGKEGTWSQSYSGGGWFSSVWGSAADDVWAVGSEKQAGIIAHWDGTAWTRVSADAANNLSRVFGAGRSALWAVGGAGHLLRWSGTAWTRTAPTTEDLWSGWAAAANDAWAVGANGTALHWDGTTWTRLNTGLPAAATVTDVWGSTSKDVWATTTKEGLYHWDGTTWSAVPAGPSGWLSSVMGFGPKDVWVAGETAMHHFDGTNWTSAPTGSANKHKALAGKGTSSLWVLGTKGSILRYHP